jgi:hypothetical protein
MFKPLGVLLLFKLNLIDCTIINDESAEKEKTYKAIVTFWLIAAIISIVLIICICYFTKRRKDKLILA